MTISSNCNKLLTGLFAALGLLLSSAHVAHADDTRKPPPGDVTSYEFEDENVHGDLYTSLGEVLHVRGRGARSSLVRARTQFIAELLKSAEQL